MPATAVTRTAVATVLVALGLALALAGPAQAASSINGKVVKKGTLPGDRIKQGTVTGTQVKESSLGLVPLAGFAKLADRAQTAVAADTAKVAETAKSADDAKKLEGRDHAAFQANAVRVVTNQAAAVPGPAGGNPSEIAVSCGPDEKATSGGAAWIIPNFQDNNQPTALDAPITGTFPVTDANGVPTGWRALGRNFSGTNRALRVYVLCSPKTA